MATLDGLRFPDGTLTTAPLAATGPSPNSVAVGRKYSGLVFDIALAGGGNAVVNVEHQRVSDGVWCTVNSNTIAVSPAPQSASVEIMNPVGNYRVNVTTLVTGTITAGYSCASPYH